MDTTHEAVAKELEARGLDANTAWTVADYLADWELASTKGDIGLAADMAQEIRADLLAATAR